MTETAQDVITHTLKIWPEFFEPVVNGWKTFDLRNNDRGFRVGDKLLLREWQPGSASYTGREVTKMVGYILRPDMHAPTAGLRSGYVILGLADH